MMLAIKEAASDMSPYVRKTAAHAIPKLYRYNPAERATAMAAIPDQTTVPSLSF